MWIRRYCAAAGAHRREAERESAEEEPRTKCLPYYLFPCADTRVFALGRPPTQSSTGHMKKKKEAENDGWLLQNTSPDKDLCIALLESSNIIVGKKN